MGLAKLLVANRGEIATRVVRSAVEWNWGYERLLIYSEDDAASLYVHMADEVQGRAGEGVPAYLDGEQILAIAKAQGCDAIHPGYGFLGENAVFARACADAGITFVGPRPEMLDLFDDKVRARDIASQAKVPILTAQQLMSNQTTRRDKL